VDPGGVDPGAEPPPGEGTASEEGEGSGRAPNVGLIALLAVAALAAGVAAVAVSRRAERRSRL
jgi:uncharacterized protein HemX